MVADLAEAWGKKVKRDIAKIIPDFSSVVARFLALIAGHF